MTESLLETEGLKKHFDLSSGVIDQLLGDPGTVRAVDGVDLSVGTGETLAIVGESGCGKSTLGRTLLKLDEPTAGTIRYDGDDLTELSEREMRPYRRDLQMIFQDPLASLNPRQTVGRILKSPMEVHDIGESDAERTERAESLLERVGLKATHLDRHPKQFSGGQQQRVAVARALSLEPDLIVADEPVSALDVSVQAQLLDLLAELQAEFDVSLLFITHDLSVVRHIADRVAVMYLGRIVETAPVEELFENPQHPYTQSLLSAVPRIDPEARVDRVILRGTVPSPSDPPDGCRFHTRCPALIPPDDWPAEQSLFRDAFSFRTKVINGDIDPSAARTQLAADGRATDPDRVAEYIVRESFDEDSLKRMPDNAREAIVAAATDLARGNEERAIDTVETEFSSPCVDSEPASVGSNQVATCHRLDSTMDHEQSTLNQNEATVQED